MTKQGTHNNAVHRLASIQDLDAMLAQHSLVPAVVKLGGVNYQVRTDLTAAEVQRFINLISNEHGAQAFTILVGTKAERDALARAVAKAEAGEDVTLPAGRLALRLDAFLDTLPRMHVNLVSGRIMRASKALAQYAKADAEVYAEYGYEPPAEGQAEEAEPVGQGESSAS